MKRRMATVVLAVMAVWGLSAMDLVEDEVLCSVSDIASVLDSEYMPGQVQTLPDKGKEGHAQVINTHSGSSYWARYLMPSHVPSVDELEEGQLILCNESFADPKPSDWAYRHQIWHFGLLTSTKEAFKGVVEVNYTRGYLQWCRLPDVPQQVAFRGGEVLCAYTQEPALENNAFATAKIQTLPSEVSRGMAEVRYANSAKGWTRYVVPSHPAKAEELKEGGWVLCSENFEKVRTELNYRYGSWYLMRITSLRDLFQEVVEANGINIPLEWLRVPEYTPEELQGIDMAEIVREAKAEEALDWIRRQRVLADWRIRKHAGRLEAELAASGSTQMSAEDARKDLEFFAGQTQQALEIITGLQKSVDQTAPPVAGPAVADSGQASADLSDQAKAHTEKGTLRYQETVRSATTELYGLVSLVAPATMESLEKARYHTPSQGDRSSDTEDAFDNYVPPPGGISGQDDSGKSLGDQIKDLEDELGEIGDDADLANVDLQNALDKQKQIIQTMSNLSKILHDTSMAVIRKN